MTGGNCEWKRMRLARFLFVLAMASAASGSPASSIFQHGHLIGGSTAYLIQSPDIAAPPPLSAFSVENDAQFKELMLRIHRAQAEADANTGGASITYAPNPDGSTTMLYPSQKDCAVFETWAEQPTTEYEESTQMGFSGIDRMEGKVVLRRFVRDNLRQIYVSYTVTVEMPPQQGTHRISFGPPSGRLPIDIGGKPGWEVISPTNYPAPQIVRDEDSIRLELYSNKTSRRMVDYIHVGRQDRMVMRKESPHEYYADDGEFAVTLPHFLVNGVTREVVAAIPETIRGPVLWVYFPGEGRYVVSFHSHPDLGFEQAGEVVGKSLTFSAGSNVFRIDAAERIATGSGAYVVTVRADSAWEPADSQDRARILIGAAIGLETAATPESQQ
jgi:hypothetical protein